VTYWFCCHILTFKKKQENGIYSSFYLSLKVLFYLVYINKSKATCLFFVSEEINYLMNTIQAAETINCTSFGLVLFHNVHKHILQKTYYSCTMFHICKNLFVINMSYCFFKRSNRKNKKTIVRRYHSEFMRRHAPEHISLSTSH